MLTSKPPRARKPGHAALNVEKEAFALLLTVVDDVDAGLDLAPDDGLHGVMTGRCDDMRIDVFAAGARAIEPKQLGRPRQTAGVCSEDTLRAV